MSVRAPGSTLRLLAPLGLMGAIFFLSAQPFDGQELAWWEVVARKIGHFSGYAALAAACAWALVGRVRRPLLWAAAISLAYSISDEYHQTFVEGRHGTAMDVGIDALGIATALLLIRAREARRRRGGSTAPRPAEA